MATYTENYNLKLPSAGDYVNVDDLNQNFIALDQIIFNSVKSIMNNIYPVGSIYINATDDRNPAAILGFGTWEHVGGGRTLIDANSSYTRGSTGGVASTTLTSANIPSHTHTYVKANATTGSTAITRAQLPSGITGYLALRGMSADSGSGWNIQQPAWANGVFTSVTQDANDYWACAPGDTRRAWDVKFDLGGKGQGHTHSIGTTSTASGAWGTASPTAVNNMQPYLAVNIWKRTA